LRYPARSAAGTADQCGKAWRAAATAESASAAVPATTVPMISSVAESVTSKVSVPPARRHPPSM